MIPSSTRSEPTQADLRAWLAEAEAIARRAGGLVAAAYRDAQAGNVPAGHQAEAKGHTHNLVTDTDRASEALIVAALAERFPEHGLRAEEGGVTRPAGAHDLAWIIDPLDGTNNFAHGIPIFAINLALVRGDEPLLGVTFDPLRDECFLAWRGGGAWLDGRRLEVSPHAPLEVSVVATGFPYDKQSNPDNNLREFGAIMPQVRGIRRLGSAALDLAYVAAGRFEAYWERGVQAWDIAAGILLVREAGGRVTDYEGGPPALEAGRIVASNAWVHAELLALLRDARQ